MRIRFSTSVYEVTESVRFVNVQVVKNGSNDIAVSVHFSTSVGTALGKYIHCRNRGNLKHHSKGEVCIYYLIPPVGDYTALSPEPNELLFSPGQSLQFRNVTIPIIHDNIREDIEQFTVHLSLPSGSTGVVLDQDTATIQIVDEDREC